jgi:ATPase family associated with various cellular activities (AAA)
MMPLPTTLVGSLVFDRSGQTLIAIDPDAIAVVALATGQTRRLAIRDARAVAGFADQLWIATHDDLLLRLDPTGRQLGPPRPLPFAARAVLQPAPCGPAAAVWSSRPALALIDDFGQIAATELGEVELVLPLTGRRFVTARGATLTLPSGLTAMLPPRTSALEGAVMADGKAAMLLVSGPTGRSLVAVALGTGQLVQRCAMPSSMVRLASRCSVAVVAHGPRALRIVDLNAGRDLGIATFDHDVLDVAIDPAGNRLAVRGAGGAIELCDVAELLRRQAAVGPGAPPIELPIAPVPHAVATGSSPHIAPVPPDPPAPAPPLSCGPLEALEPRRRPPATDRARARHQLDRELRGVALWALGAIAAAWDSRKLGYGNEGRHPYELEVGAILGVNRGFATDYLAGARDHLADHERAVASDPAWRAADTPLGAMIHELGLAPLAVDIVLVIAAAALRGEIARLYGILANDTGRAIVDELLVQQVLEDRHDRHDVAAALDARGRLVHLGIVHVSARRARPFAELTVDPAVLAQLRAVEPDLGPAVAVRRAERALEALDIPHAVLAAALAALARTPSGGPGAARIAVRGRVGSGRRTLSCALAARAGRDLAEIDALALPRTADRFVVELRRALRAAQLSGMVPCIAQLGEVTFDEHPARDVAAEPLRSHPGPIIVIASPDEAVPFSAGHVAIELPVLAETERLAVWSDALGNAGLTVADRDALAARYRVGPGVIRRAVAAASGATGDATPVIEGYIRQTRDARLGHHARRVSRLASWSNVVFPSDLLDSLRELVARVRHGRQVYETWGMNRMAATARGLTALFQGPPGTGKTLVAGVIARELGLDLYQVDLSKVMSKWIGETERNLATIFDAAEDGQVILLFDEADSLFAKRTEVRSSNDRYANLEVNYLLQRLDAFEGIAILTTNTGTSIDRAFKRRMSFRLSFPFPDEETRAELWRAHLPPELPVGEPLAFEALAHKYELSGGYIRNACLRAAFLAAQDETAMHQRHLERAVALEFAELGKLSSGGAID